MKSAPRSSFDVTVTGAKGEWDEKYSDKSRYVADDLFLHYIAKGFADRLRKSRFSFYDWAVFGLLGIMAALFVALQLNELLRFRPPFLLGALQPLSLLSEWSQRWFGAGYAPILIGILIVTFVYEYFRIRGVARDARYLQQQLHGAMLNQDFLIQLYPGGGSLRFTYGENGLFIDGGNLHTRIDWHAFEPNRKVHASIKATETPGGLFTRPKRDFTTKLPVPIDEATHLILFLKEDPVEDTPYIECLVIPRRGFFDSERNCTPWPEFCAGIDKYLP